MVQLSKKISVNGWVNLLTLLQANGWTGRGIVSFLTIYNASAVTTLYVHRGAADNTGLTATDGLPILDDSYTWSNTKVNLAKTMLNTAAGIDIIFDVNDE